MLAQRKATDIGDYSGLLSAYGAMLGQRLLDEANALTDALDHINKIRAAQQRIKDQRLTDLMLAKGPHRAKDDLSRNLYRTLKELRIQQLWRNRNQAIDVTPKISK